MRADALDRVVAAGHFGNDRVVIVRVEPSAVANLPAGFGVEGRVVEDDFALVTGLEFLRALAVVDDRQCGGTAYFGLRVPYKLRLNHALRIQRITKLLFQLSIYWIRRLLPCTLPGGPCTFALSGDRLLKACFVEYNVLVAARIGDEVFWQTKCLKHTEGLFARISRSLAYQLSKLRDLLGAVRQFAGLV